MPACLLFEPRGTLVEHEHRDQGLSLGRTLVEARSIRPQLAVNELQRIVETAFNQLNAVSAETGREFHQDQLSQCVLDMLAVERDPVMVSRLSEAWAADCLSTLVPVPGAAGIMRRLAGHYRLGLITNTHSPLATSKLIESLGLAGVFEIVTTSVGTGFRKPDRRIFEHALCELEIMPAEAVYVGDSYERDYQGALAAGMSCYLIGSHARVPRTRQLRSVLDLAIHFSV